MEETLRSIHVQAILQQYIKRFQKAQSKDFMFGSEPMKEIWPYDESQLLGRHNLDNEFAVGEDADEPVETESEEDKEPQADQDDWNDFQLDDPYHQALPTLRILMAKALFLPWPMFHPRRQITTTLEMEELMATIAQPKMRVHFLMMKFVVASARQLYEPLVTIIDSRPRPLSSQVNLQTSMTTGSVVGKNNNFFGFLYICINALMQ